LHAGPRTTDAGSAGWREAGDEEDRRLRYATIVRKRGAALRGIAAEYAQTREDREDLYQDMALAIWNALPQFRGESSLATGDVREVFELNLEGHGYREIAKRTGISEGNVGARLTRARLRRRLGRLAEA
jgi:DNA-directed RNA polymerase specialized sigma24 family protein